MHTIHRYELPISDQVTVRMPREAEILSVATGDRYPNSISVWAKVFSEAPLARRTFWIVGTGNPLPADIDKAKFVGTVKHDHNLIWHIYDRGEVIQNMVSDQ